MRKIKREQEREQEKEQEREQEREQEKEQESVAILAQVGDPPSGLSFRSTFLPLKVCLC